MFARDQRLIADMVQPGSDGWLDWAGAVTVAVSFTIQNDTPNVQTHIDNLVADGWNSRAINFETRRLAVNGVLTGAHIPHFEEARRCMDAGDMVGAQCALMMLPGIGLPKSGFILQLIWGVGGCIDSENQEIYGVKVPNPGKSLSSKARRKHVEAYQELCATHCAPTEQLWDAWCGHIAHKFNNWRVNKNGVRRKPQPQRDGTPWTADAVSALHPVWVRDCFTALRRMQAVATVDAMAAD